MVTCISDPSSDMWLSITKTWSRLESTTTSAKPILDGLNNLFLKVFSIKPGITGLWQVSGRNNLTYKTRIKLDLNYVDNHNFLMDIRILIRTIGVILFPLDRGAY